MGTYEMELKQMGWKIGISFAIASILGIVFSITSDAFATSFNYGIGNALAIGIMLGSLIAIFWTSKNNMIPSLANLALGVVKNLFWACVHSSFSNGLIGMAFSLIGALICMALGFVVLLFLSISFPLTLVFLIVMTVLERMDRLPSEEITAVLNKSMPVISGVVSVAITWAMFSGI